MTTHAASRNQQPRPLVSLLTLFDTSKIDSVKAVNALLSTINKDLFLIYDTMSLFPQILPTTSFSFFQPCWRGGYTFLAGDSVIVSLPFSPKGKEGNGIVSDSVKQCQ